MKLANGKYRLSTLSALFCTDIEVVEGRIVSATVSEVYEVEDVNGEPFIKQRQDRLIDGSKKS